MRNEADPISQPQKNDQKNDSAAMAEEAGLRYVHDHHPGFSRKPRGKKFIYLDHSGERVTSDAIIHRINSLVLPPAWEGVWICKFANGHLQATGRDQRERKQYRYHSKWSTMRNENKFEKLSKFGHALPELRKHVNRDLNRSDLSRENVLAAVVKVMEQTMIRVGNEEYAHDNNSYGLTTILNRHVKVEGSTVRMRFKGKSGILHEAELCNKRLSNLIRRCQELPGQELFEYRTSRDEIHDVTSDDVNQYLRDITGEAITAKDFRTWGATVEATTALFELGQPQKESEAEYKRRHREAVKAAAEYLRNTATVCRKYYVHPAVFEADESGKLVKAFAKAQTRPKFSSALSVAENAVLEILK